MKNCLDNETRLDYYFDIKTFIDKIILKNVKRNVT